MLKTCLTCKTAKLLAEFSKHGKRVDGKQDNCKVCACEIAKKWYKAHKHDPAVAARLAKWTKATKQQLQDEVNQIKREAGCKYCGECEACCLDFHHIGKKDRDVSRWVHCKSPKKLYAEIKRCIVVCSNCHRKIHAGLLKP